MWKQNCMWNIRIQNKTAVREFVPSPIRAHKAPPVATPRHFVANPASKCHLSIWFRTQWTDWIQFTPLMLRPVGTKGSGRVFFFPSSFFNGLAESLMRQPSERRAAWRTTELLMALLLHNAALIHIRHGQWPGAVRHKWECMCVDLHHNQTSVSKCQNLEPGCGGAHARLSKKGNSDAEAPLAQHKRNNKTTCRKDNVPGINLAAADVSLVGKVCSDPSVFTPFIQNGKAD